MAKYGSMCNDEIIEAFKEKVRDTDIFCATEAKSGQTWLTTLLYHLKTKGKSLDYGGNGIMGAIPWLELPFNITEGDFEPYKINERVEVFESIENPRIFKMHVRWNKVPVTAESKAKIITITRDPRDLPYSMYNHLNGMKQSPIEPMPFEQYFEGWLERMNIIPWMHSFWPHRNDPNLLWLRYEDMKLDIEGTARKILNFTGWEVSDEELEKAIDLSSFGHMKKNERNLIKKGNTAFREDFSFIREGKVGKNRAMLTEDMEKRMMEKIRSELPEEAVEWLLSDPSNHLD